VVEVVAGLSLAYAWNWAGGPTRGVYDGAGKFLAGAIILLVFILITVIDVEHRLILHVVVLPAAAVIGLIGFLTPGRGPVKTLLGGLAGYGLVLGIFLLGQFFSLVVARLRGQALDEIAFGEGDVNLAGVAGLTVGWPGVLVALFVAVIASGLFSLGYVLVQTVRRRYSLFTPLPYGPFLALGALLVYFFGKPLAAWYLGR
jgi:leader peptidase (prepilin peptidase)/N-methyltransferase